MAAGPLHGCGGSDDPPKDAATPADTGVTPSDAAVAADAGGDAGGLPVDAGRDAGRLTDAATDAGPTDTPVPGSDPPVLTKVGYFNDELGARILLQGTDPNGDVAHYTVKFFKGTTPVLLDADGDSDTPDTSSYTNTLAPTPGSKAFSARFDPSLDLLDKVDKIAVSVDDAKSNVSAELSAVLADLDADSNVSLDLGDVTYIDSTGLRVLLTARDAATQAGGGLRVSATSSIVARLIEITGASDLLES